MKIIITKTFNKKYLNKLSKYFTINDFLKQLNKNNNILLKNPFYKVKLNLNLVDFRWVILLVEKNKIVPLILCLKKDKNCWENIILEKYYKDILFSQEKALEDLNNWDYEVY